MSLLGRPYRIMYEAARLETGLSLVSVRILRPDGIVHGPFSLDELPAPFLGRYYYDFPTLLSYPEGEYFAFISSPGDATFTTFRFNLYREWATPTVVTDAVTAAQTAILDAISVLTNAVEASGNTGVQTLLDRLTQNRADLLDNLANLDMSISSIVSAAKPSDGIIDIEVMDIEVADVALTVEDNDEEIGIEIEENSSEPDVEVFLEDDSEDAFLIEVEDDDEEIDVEQN